jgi:hypothetical protein
VPDLAFYHRLLAAGGAAHPHQAQGGDDRRQRVPQLVTEHGEELLLGPAGGLRLGAGALGGGVCGRQLRGLLLDPAPRGDLIADLLIEGHHPTIRPSPSRNGR